MSKEEELRLKKSKQKTELMQYAYKITISRTSNVENVENHWLFNSVSQPFFGSQHPCLVIKIFGGTLIWYNRYKFKEILTIGTSSWHPSDPQSAPIFVIIDSLIVIRSGYCNHD